MSVFFLSVVLAAVTRASRVVAVPERRVRKAKRLPPTPGARMRASSLCGCRKLRGLERGLFQDYENSSACVRADLSVHFRVGFVNQTI